MTSPTQSAMEQQQREAFEAWCDRNHYYREGKRIYEWRYGREELRTSYPPKDVDLAWGAWNAALSSQASELRSLRDSLALARSHIGELREALEWMVDTFCDRSRPPKVIQASVATHKAIAALNKAQPCEEMSLEWTHPCKGFGGKLLQVPLGEQCDRCGESAEQP